MAELRLLDDVGESDAPDWVIRVAFAVLLGIAGSDSQAKNFTLRLPRPLQQAPVVYPTRRARGRRERRRGRK